MNDLNFNLIPIEYSENNIFILKEGKNLKCILEKFTDEYGFLKIYSYGEKNIEYKITIKNKTITYCKANKQLEFSF